MSKEKSIMININPMRIWDFFKSKSKPGSLVKKLVSKESQDAKIVSMLARHEGYRQFVYTDSEGVPTVGYGLNLRDRGLSQREALSLLTNDVRSLQEILKCYDWYGGLSHNRKMVVVNMSFQLGIFGFLRFKKMIEYLKASAYEKAATEMLKSKWAEQTPKRAKELAEIMRNG